MSTCYLHTVGSRLEAFCVAETDAIWNTWWPNTTNGTVAVQKCPGGPNSIGKDETFAKHTTSFYCIVYAHKCIVQEIFLLCMPNPEE